MAENLKYLSTIPPEPVPVEANADSAVVESAPPVADTVGASGTLEPARAYGDGSAPAGDNSKTLAMGALILSLALILLLAGLILRRKFREPEETEPDLVEMDKRRMRDALERSTASPVRKPDDESPAAAEPQTSRVVSFDEETDPGESEAKATDEGKGSADGNGPAKEEKRIPVKAPPKPKRRF